MTAVGNSVAKSAEPRTASPTETPTPIADAGAGAHDKPEVRRRGRPVEPFLGADSGLAATR